MAQREMWQEIYRRNEIDRGKNIGNNIDKKYL